MSCFKPGLESVLGRFLIISCRLRYCNVENYEHQSQIILLLSVCYYVTVFVISTVHSCVHTHPDYYYFLVFILQLHTFKWLNAQIKTERVHQVACIC